MNLRNTCPDIPDDWRGNVTDTCRVLGAEKPISRQSIYNWAKLGKRNGGIDWMPSRNGKMMFSGKEVKRFWREY